MSAPVEESMSLLQSDGELRATWSFIEHMLTNPDHLYDAKTLAELRDDLNYFLSGYRGACARQNPTP